MATASRHSSASRLLPLSNSRAAAVEPGEPDALAAVSVPTLVTQGTADWMFPIDNGEAVVREILRVNLLRLDGAGHGLLRVDWQPVA